MLSPFSVPWLRDFEMQGVISPVGPWGAQRGGGLFLLTEAQRLSWTGGWWWWYAARMGKVHVVGGWASILI